MRFNPAIQGKGFHHIGLRVSDFDRSLHFYAEVLGFEKSILCGEGEKRAIMLDCGGNNYIELFAGGACGARPDDMVVHLALETDDCAGAVQRLREMGIEIHSGPDDCALPFYEGASVRIAFVKGPDGENIELYQQLT